MRFREIFEGSDNQIELGRAAFLLTTLEYPEIDVDRWLARLDVLAGEVRARSAATADDLERLEAVPRYLFGELELRGVFRIHGGDATEIEDVEHYLAESGEISDREEMEKLIAEADRKLRVVH